MAVIGRLPLPLLSCPTCSWAADCLAAPRSAGDEYQWGVREWCREALAIGGGWRQQVPGSDRRRQRPLRPAAFQRPSGGWEQERDAGLSTSEGADTGSNSWGACRRWSDCCWAPRTERRGPGLSQRTCGLMTAVGIRRGLSGTGLGQLLVRGRVGPCTIKTSQCGRMLGTHRRAHQCLADDDGVRNAIIRRGTVGTDACSNRGSQFHSDAAVLIVWATAWSAQ